MRLRPGRYADPGIYVLGSVHQPADTAEALFQAYLTRGAGGALPEAGEHHADNSDRLHRCLTVHRLRQLPAGLPHAGDPHDQARERPVAGQRGRDALHRLRQLRGCLPGESHLAARAGTTSRFLRRSARRCSAHQNGGPEDPGPGVRVERVWRGGHGGLAAPVLSGQCPHPAHELLGALRSVSHPVGLHQRRGWGAAGRLSAGRVPLRGGQPVCRESDSRSSGPK